MLPRRIAGTLEQAVPDDLSERLGSVRRMHDINLSEPQSREGGPANFRIPLSQERGLRNRAAWMRLPGARWPGIRIAATAAILCAIAGCQARDRCALIGGAAVAGASGAVAILGTNIGMAKAEAEHQLGPRPSGSNTQLWQVPVALVAGFAVGELLGYSFCN